MSYPNLLPNKEGPVNRGEVNLRKKRVHFSVVTGCLDLSERYFVQLKEDDSLYDTSVE